MKEIAIISSSFYGFYEKALVQNALNFVNKSLYDWNIYDANEEKDIGEFVNQCFEEKFKKITINDVNFTIVVVPGGLEIPQAMQWLIDGKNFDGILVTSCVIKGKTTHFEHVCNELISGVCDISLKSKIPTTSAIVTALTEEDANERCIYNGKNLGFKAMDALFSMVEIKNTLSINK